MNPTGKITINNRAAKYANSWNEVTPSIAKGIAPFLLGQKSVELQQANELATKGKGNNQERIDAANELYAQVAVPTLLKIIESNNPLFWKEVAKLQPEHYAMILADEENPVKWCFKVELVKQLFPKITHQTKTYYGPRDYLRGVTFGEYIAAQQVYSAWLKNRTKGNLARFFAILYRPERTDVKPNHTEYHNDIREPFSPVLSGKYAKSLITFNTETMLASILYWQGCHARMRVDYVHVFSGTSSKNPDPGAVVIQLAKSPGKDDVDQILNAPIHNIMRKINADAKAKR